MEIVMPTIEQIYAIDSKISVMKPAVSKKDDSKHKQKLEAMLADPDVAGEEKIDGCHYKMIACRFLSKDHVDKTDNFMQLTTGFIKLGMPNLILDGEINYPGMTSQYCTRVTGSSPDQAIKFQIENGPIHYTIFDILRLPNGQWVCNRPYKERRALLETLVRDYISKIPELKDIVRATKMTLENKQQFLNEILDSGAEGIVLKRLDSLYLFGKKPLWQWMKVKQADSADLVIMGVKPPTCIYGGGAYDNWPYWALVDGMQRPVTKAYYNGWIGAFQMGAMVNGELTFICYAAGISEEIQKDFKANPNKYLNHVARIDFMEKTTDGFPRHPSFKGLHEDKTPEECTWEF